MTKGWEPRWDIDLATGNQSEALFDERLRGKIELKQDWRWVETGNVFIEYECRGLDGRFKPSGIATTESKFWAFQLSAHPFYILIETDWLKKTARLAWRKQDIVDRYFRRAECVMGDCPTRGVIITIQEILDARDKTLDVRPKAEEGQCP